MSVDQFHCIFSNKDLNKVYEEFLQRNMAWENLGFYMEVEHFRSLPGDKLAGRAEEIFSTFVEVDSIHELGDITFQLREDVRHSLEAPTRDMFDILCEIVLESLVNSTITDFLSDSLFTNYVQAQFPSDCRKSSSSVPPSRILSCIF